MKTAAALVAVVALSGCGSSDPNPDKLAENIGAESCEQTTFYVESKLNGDKTRIYDCYFREVARYRCVTESGNVATDETDTVKALFADTFETDKPRCATSSA